MDAFTAIAEPRRRAILRLVREEPRAVSEIAEHFDISQQAVSQHLKVLKDAGLVTDRAAGTRRIYTVDQEGLGMLRAYLDQFWSRSLANFKAAAEQEDS
jgi:DNA-binding transcriptional ArsR family regulator